MPDTDIGHPSRVLAVVPGATGGAERARIRIVETKLAAELDVRECAADAIPAEAAAVLVGDAAELIEHESFAARARHVRPEATTVVIGWLTRRCEALTSAQWTEVDRRADALLAPTSALIRAAMRQQVPRTRLHLVPHPLTTHSAPAVRAEVVPGSVVLICDEPNRLQLRQALSRLSTVSVIHDLASPPVEQDASFWGQEGRAIDQAMVVAYAMSDHTGHDLAALMARGASIVAWGSGAARDAIVPGISGWLVPLGAPNDLARVVDAVLRDRWLRESAGIAAHDRALSRNDPLGATRQIAGIVTALTGHRQTPGWGLGTVGRERAG